MLQKSINTRRSSLHDKERNGSEIQQESLKFLDTLPRQQQKAPKTLTESGKTRIENEFRTR